MSSAEPKLEKTQNYFKNKLELDFKDWSLARMAITHSSAKELDMDCNERLEFLGDSILGLVVSEFLYASFPEKEEGELSIIKSVLVSSKTLSAVAEKIGLDKVIITGKGISAERIPSSILANTVEALVAAIYLDFGLEKAREFILGLVIKKNISRIIKDKHEKNYKSLLQDFAQQHSFPLPTYKVGKEVGPDHKKRFAIYVNIENNDYGPAWGYSKKEAEQKVAKIALTTLGVLKETKTKK